ECKVSRTGSAGGLGRRWVVWRQGALVRVELVDEELVQAEVGGHGEAVGGIDVDRVAVWTLLPARVSALAPMLDERGCFLQLPVCVDGQHRNAAAAVVGDQNVLASAIDNEVARAGAHR